jgi:hypothetical protein
VTRSGRKRTLHGAAHKVDLEVRTEADDDVRTGKRPVPKRTFNEAAHKLGYSPSAQRLTASRQPLFPPEVDTGRLSWGDFPPSPRLLYDGSRRPPG